MFLVLYYTLSDLIMLDFYETFFFKKSPSIELIKKASQKYSLLFHKS